MLSLLLFLKKNVNLNVLFMLLYKLFVIRLKAHFKLLPFPVPAECDKVVHPRVIRLVEVVWRYHQIMYLSFEARNEMIRVPVRSSKRRGR